MSLPRGFDARAMVMLSPELQAKFPHVTVAWVDVFLSYAVASLAAHGPWSRELVEQAAKSLRIIVNPFSAWKDMSGQSVGGQAYFYTVAVDAGLTSLCHELAHVLEFSADGRIDLNHDRWTERGIAVADADYRQKLDFSGNPQSGP